MSTLGHPPKAPGATIDRNGVVTLFLIANFLEVFARHILEDVYGFGVSWRAIRAAELTSPRYA
jgi:hypothetical protein